MSSYTNHAQKMLVTQGGNANDVSKKFRDEYIDTLQNNKLLGTTRGGGVSHLGFPAASDLLADLIDVDASGESNQHKFDKPTAQPKPVVEPVRAHSLEHFAAMVEMVQPKAKATESPEKAVA